MDSTDLCTWNASFIAWASATGASDAELARRLDTSRVSVWRWRRGAMPRPSVRRRVERASGGLVRA